MLAGAASPRSAPERGATRQLPRRGVAAVEGGVRASPRHPNHNPIPRPASAGAATLSSPRVLPDAAAAVPSGGGGGGGSLDARDNAGAGAAAAGVAGRGGGGGRRQKRVARGGEAQPAGAQLVGMACDVWCAGPACACNGIHCPHMHWKGLG